MIGASIPLYPSREYALVTVRAKPFSFGIFNLMLHWLVFKSTFPLLPTASHPRIARHTRHETHVDGTHLTSTRHVQLAGLLPAGR